jgi:Spy/CpxP family protein refolding chaperone
MNRRRWFLGAIAAATVALVGAATAFAVGGHPRHGIMKRMVSAAIDEALDAAKVTPEQRARIHAARDRAMAAIETHMTDRRGRLDDLLATFEADRIDPARIQAMRAHHEDEHRRMADAVQGALIEIHDTLTAEQRRAVTDWVRAHRRWHTH